MQKYPQNNASKDYNKETFRAGKILQPDILTAKVLFMNSGKGSRGDYII